MDTTVRQLIHRKGTEIWATQPDSTILDALTLMAEKGIGALLVFEGSQLVGIFSERDYARKVILKGKSSQETTVSEIMTKKVVFIQPHQTMKDCLALMTDKRIRHLPVMEGNVVIGIISIGDVVKEIISEQEFVIDQLENYIGGSR
jgi:CBS domain-containing protein